MEQLRIFEKESYEIQAKIKRGFEVERENENIAKAVDTMRDKERDFIRQIEDLKQVIKMKDNEIDRFKGTTQNVSHFSKSLEKENLELREEV